MAVQRLFVFLILIAPALLMAEAEQPTNDLRISTSHSALTLRVGRDGRVYHFAYGSLASNPPAVKHPAQRETELYPPYGDGFVLEPALEATHVDGNTSTDLIYVTNESTVFDDNIQLIRISLKDRFYPFFVDLCFKCYAAEDVIEEWSEIRHDENGEVALDRFASSSLPVSSKEYWLTQFHGDWASEGEMSEERLTPGIKVLDSKLGVRASRYRTPSFILALNGPVQESNGEVLGGSLEWSSSYEFSFEVDWANRLRVTAGINPFASEYHLARGKTFKTPGMLWTWSDQGKGQVSRNFHRWARRYGIRDGDKPRPVLLNNWEATYFDFNEPKLVSLLDQAKELGFELFLLDDGWFGNKYPRNGDTSGLGDWQANTNKLPHGLSYLADQAVERGLRFGIWLEPEMVNPKSELYENHPDWAIGQPHRKPELQRNQLNLDLSNPRVQQFAWKTIDDTLRGSTNITYVKWDANRYVTQPGSTYLKPGEQSHLFIDYTFALYDIMRRMTNDYPNVMAMLCSGGGGRADYGALKYFDSFWPSDNTDPARRVFIQWGFSHFFPACTICAHVTRSGDRPLKFTLDVAMSEDLGFDVDLAKTTPQDRQYMSNAIALYKKELREVVGQGDLYRIESPYDGPRACLDYVSPDKLKAALFVYQLKSGDGTSVKPQGLDPHTQYVVHELNLPDGASSRMAANGETIDGATLMREGVAVTCKDPYQSAIVEFVAGTVK